MKVDWNKDIQTRDGERRFYIGQNPINKDRLVAMPEGVVLCYSEDGMWSKKEGCYDLINVPEEEEMWITKCTHKDTNIPCKCLSDFEQAPCSSNVHMTAKKKITIKEGEGL
jgi:hypothetical protein